MIEATSEPTAAPYAGLRVLELARVLAGPWIGQILADLGAQVIKVESPAGDETRRWGPPFLENADGSAADAAYFHACNRGKESLVLDFRHAEDRQRAVALACEADVLIENFKAGGLAKYGLDYASLASRNPALVYCSISGFGQQGRHADRPGYDFVAQAMSGLMDVTGEPGRPPQKVGVAVADLVTGLYGLVGIQAALAERARSGRGQHVDVALLDCTIGILANQALNCLIGNLAPTRMGNAHPNIVPYQEFRTANGFVVVAVGNDAQFRCLCEALGRATLASDPRFAANGDRVRNRADLERELAPLFAALRREDVLARLQAARVPAGPINTVAEALADPNTRERGMVVDCPAEGYRRTTIPGLATPIRFSRSKMAAARPAPRLGSAGGKRGAWSSQAAVPDSTAVRVALWRALHVQIDSAPHIFEDQIGLALAAPAEDWRRRPDMDPIFTRPFRASIVARSRFIEDLALEQQARGVSQYVILGSGLDTFAQRRPDVAARMRVFEVDRPGAQQWKRRRLVELGCGVPEWLRLVPVDFETHASWWQELMAAGFDATQPAVIGCAGVSMYLTREALAATLRQVARLAAGSTLAMTFLLPLELMEPDDRPGFQLAEKGAKASGTPFVSFFSPSEMLALARASGFKAARHVSPADLTERYFKDRSDGLRLSSGEQLLVAGT